MSELATQIRRIAELYSTQDKNRAIAYNRAYNSLVEFEEKHDRPPTTDEALDLKWIGDSIFQDILEYNKTGKIERLEKLEEVEPEKLLRSTVDDFRSRLLDLSYTFEIAGSYRRGAETMADIDVVFKEVKPTDTIENIVRRMKEVFKMQDLSISDNIYRGFIELDQDGIRSWRIDMITTSLGSWYTSLLYFTGPVDFNVRIRQRAKDLGLKLNRYKLASRMDDGDETVLPVRNEEDIFEYLGLEYMTPKDRYKPLQEKSVVALVTENIVFDSVTLDFIPPGAKIVIAPDMLHMYSHIKRKYPLAEIVQL